MLTLSPPDRSPRPHAEKMAFFAPLVESAIQFWDKHPDALREVQQAILNAGTGPAARTDDKHVSPAPPPAQAIAASSEQEQYRQMLATKRAWAKRIAAMVRWVESDDADQVRDLLAEHKQALDAMNRRIQFRASPTALAQMETRLVEIEGSVRSLLTLITS